MNSRLVSFLATPAGATFAALGLFFALFWVFSQDITSTLVGVVTAALGALILVQPDYGLVLLVINGVAALGSYFEMPRVGPVSLPLAIQGILLLSFSLRMALFRKRLYLNLVENWLLLGYASCVTLSLMMADRLGNESLQETQRLILGLLFYVIIANLLEGWPAVQRLVRALVLCDAILVVSGLLYYFGYLEPSMDPERILGRTAGLIGNPNGLAFALIGLLPVVVALGIGASTLFGRLGILALLGANLFVILNTLSRGGFISLVAVSLFLVYRFGTDRRLLALVIVLALVTYVLLPTALLDRFEGTGTLKGNSRWVLTVIGLNMALDNPVFGVGLGNFIHFFPRYDVLHRGGATAPHNLYTSIAAQSGIPALILYLAWLSLLFIRQGQGWHMFRRAGEDRLALLAAALQASLVNVFVFGLSGHLELEHLVFVIGGLSVALNRLRRASVATGDPGWAGTIRQPVPAP